MNDYLNSYGYWEVTTEGDVEGRTTYKLGKYKGHVDVIAFYLKKEQFYALTFRKIVGKIISHTAIDEIVTDKDISHIKKGDTVNIKFDIDSKTWDKSNSELIKYFSSVLVYRPVEVIHCNYYAAVTLVAKKRNYTEKKKQLTNKLDKLIDKTSNSSINVDSKQNSQLVQNLLNELEKYYDKIKNESLSTSDLEFLNRLWEIVNDDN